MQLFDFTFQISPATETPNQKTVTNVKVFRRDGNGAWKFPVSHFSVFPIKIDDCPEIFWNLVGEFLELHEREGQINFEAAGYVTQRYSNYEVWCEEYGYDKQALNMQDDWRRLILSERDCRTCLSLTRDDFRDIYTSTKF